MNKSSAPAINATVAEALAKAERSGFRLMLVGRSIVLAAAGLWFAYGFTLSGNPSGLVLVAISLALGLGGVENPWHRRRAPLAVLIDAAMLAAGNVPRILVFRAYGIHFLWVMLAISALALSPRLILFTGAALITVVWTVFAVAVSQLGGPRSWSDLPPNTTPHDYTSLLLDINFIGTGNRLEETGALLLATGILSFAVKRARDLTIAYAIEEEKRCAPSASSAAMCRSPSCSAFSPPPTHWAPPCSRGACCSSMSKASPASPKAAARRGARRSRPFRRTGERHRGRP